MLRAEKLFLRRGEFMLQRLDFTVPTHDYFVLLGRSGSGKTMLLESIAGIQPIEGRLYWEDREITRLPPERRDFGFVYQDFALFPNFDVRGNIRFAERYKPIVEAEKLFEDLVDFLGLSSLLDRNIRHLSGGEKQRVALARAIFSRPKMLLLDEPLSAIDPTFRNAIMASLKEIASRYDTTVLHVTHNFREASYLADHIAVILDGKILQTGRAEEVLHKPTSIEVAKFLGFKNLFPASLLGFDQEQRYFTIDPNKIRFDGRCREGDYRFDCTVERIMGITDHYKIFASVGTHRFFAKVPKALMASTALREGAKTPLCFNRKDIGII